MGRFINQEKGNLMKKNDNIELGGIKYKVIGVEKPLPHFDSVKKTYRLKRLTGELIYSVFQYKSGGYGKVWSI